MKSLEPFDKKLGTDTWYYTKRCFLSLIENLAKHMIVLRDAVIQECVAFLENCESEFWLFFPYFMLQLLFWFLQFTEKM